MWGVWKSRLEIIPSTFYYYIQGRNLTFATGNGSKFEISLGTGCKSQLLGGMTYTVRDGFYALTWTFILVLTYFAKKIQKINAHPPKSAVPFTTPNWQKWLGNLDETMIRQSAGYIFLRYEIKFQTPDEKALIWHPAMVSMIKTQLTIRQNVNKVKIKKCLLFFNCGLVLFVFLALGG